MNSRPPETIMYRCWVGVLVENPVTGELELVARETDVEFTIGSTTYRDTLDAFTGAIVGATQGDGAESEDAAAGEPAGAHSPV